MSVFADVAPGLYFSCDILASMTVFDFFFIIFLFYFYLEYSTRSDGTRCSFHLSIPMAGCRESRFLCPFTVLRPNSRRTGAANRRTTKTRWGLNYFPVSPHFSAALPFFFLSTYSSFLVYYFFRLLPFICRALYCPAISYTTK